MHPPNMRSASKSLTAFVVGAAMQAGVPLEALQSRLPSGERRRAVNAVTTAMIVLTPARPTCVTPHFLAAESRLDMDVQFGHSRQLPPTIGVSQRARFPTSRAVRDSATTGAPSGGRAAARPPRR